MMKQKIIETMSLETIPNKRCFESVLLVMEFESLNIYLNKRFIVDVKEGMLQN